MGIFNAKKAGKKGKMAAGTICRNVRGRTVCFVPKGGGGGGGQRSASKTKNRVVQIHTEGRWLNVKAREANAMRADDRAFGRPVRPTRKVPKGDKWGARNR